MIWKDIDQDGIQDDGEEGVADVKFFSRVQFDPSERSFGQQGYLQDSGSVR